MMKRVIAFLFAFGAVLLLGACGGEKEAVEEEKVKEIAVEDIYGIWVGTNQHGKSTYAFLIEESGDVYFTVLQDGADYPTTSSFPRRDTSKTVVKSIQFGTDTVNIGGDGTIGGGMPCLVSFSGIKEQETAIVNSGSEVITINRFFYYDHDQKLHMTVDCDWLGWDKDRFVCEKAE